MSLVFCVSYPFQVVSTIVGRVAIYMVDLWLALWVGYKCFGHKPVGFDELLRHRGWLQVVDKVFAIPASFAS